ncbi:CRISPR-associated helicase Cas3' [Clostridium sp. NSJ-145]|uniref:CRISPR-associated helicase Cas3' n=1 Tax=Clostridium sp. NSJ-145 TaxID=2897777 RepID=UPI001E2D9C9B|nr:CRISPR-associated helicase Cas3' [Clostridium sp. NSJ-145]MCD2503226.1 CRISPR-associated helicase Cas3' [Clostridium sp. NSJ-145]MDY3359766.1 CRISPR-associated helicase Cas3' [Clostridium celatum]
MRDRMEIIDKDTLELMEERLAKPDKSIKKHTEELLEVLDLLYEFGYIDNERVYELVEKACLYHDLGKLNDEFQKRVKGKNIRFNENKEVVHNVLSLYFINSNKFNAEKDYLTVAHSVLNHHNYGSVFEIINNNENLIKYLLNGFNTINFSSRTKSKLAKKELINDIETIKVKGFLHKCDYCASAGIPAEYRNDFLGSSLNNLLISWQESNKEAKWNELQEFCLENKNENIIAVAQTGMGKTEAGLLWIGDTKGFFILPIRTAINAIYDRVRVELLDNKHIDDRVAILHSSSMEYYLRNITNNVEGIEKIDLLNYHKVGKQLSLPLNISTMDQIFDFVFKYPGYELKLATLGYSKIVIDEIQAYGPDLLAYLICGIENVVALGGKVAILTATLPPFIKDLLKRNITFKENNKAFTTDTVRHNLKVMDKRIDADDIIEKFKENKKLDKSNKILVVCNTIKEAQRLYEDLKNKVEKEELHILHSKFIRKDRLEKEQEIIEFGKTFNKNKEIDKQSGVWISTSIVEASLDIDFDYLFTELQDLNSLFQRLGRCNRKGKKSAEEHNCYIYTEINEANIINGKKGFIDGTLFSLSKEAITGYDGPISENKKVEMIENYLTTDNLVNSDYMIEYRKVYNDIKDIQPYKFEKDKIDLRNILSEDIIPSPIYERYLGDIKEIEEKLKDREIDIYERIRLKDALRQYTVSVHPNDVGNYERNRITGKAMAYGRIFLGSSGRDYIKIIECEYDESGYKKMKYEKQTRDSAIW